MLILDEESGHFDLHPRSLPPSAEELPEFHAAIKKWCRQIARGWVRRRIGNRYEYRSTTVEFFNDSSGKFQTEGENQ
jgi:hypothetical protein